MGHKTLILGGVRSGKSRFAIEQSSKFGSSRVYIATAQPLDAEMARRIQKHRQDRSPDWKTIEEPYKLCQVLESINGTTDVVVIDCLTLWLSNQLSIRNQKDNKIQDHIEQLTGVMESINLAVIAVSNEVGLGVIPSDLLSRRFVDFSGFLHQRLSDISQEVFLMMAGNPIPIKRNPHGNH
ncbi:MAG TPA: bifunctional adenosylcobinamide kinase/adenosylcobinamide-phosphate guanylyltransferase [Nitrospiria bacterium]|jgi:adenosylcobinamide kinase/adenosylcobinamide-phosphate guanylyltransferase